MTRQKYKTKNKKHKTDKIGICINNLLTHLNKYTELT